jgi:hypothetical protein
MDGKAILFLVWLVVFSILRIVYPQINLYIITLITGIVAICILIAIECIIQSRLFAYLKHIEFH